MANDLFAVIDCETSALFDFSKPADAEGQPRLAHLAMILVDSEFNIQSEYDRFIKPDGWTIDPGAAAVNGLTLDRLMADGVPVREALDEYTRLVKAGRVIVAFSAQFDTKVLRGELRRAGMDDLFMDTRNICVMRGMTDVCQLPYANGRAGFKFPKLAEALAYIGAPVADEGAHTAMGDARGALEITRWLAKNQMLPMAGVHLAKKKPDLVPTPRRSSGKPKVAAADDEIPA
jgi:DNA polymerase III epsilon subunit-like protein